MSPEVGAFAIVPSNNLTAAAGWDCEVHLTQAGTGRWSVPEKHNPFGVFIRTPDVAEIASRVDETRRQRGGSCPQTQRSSDLIIRPGGVLRHREWGMYELGVSGPDGLLVRIGWPSYLIQGPEAAKP